MTCTVCKTLPPFNNHDPKTCHRNCEHAIHDTGATCFSRQQNRKPENACTWCLVREEKRAYDRWMQLATELDTRHASEETNL